MAIKKIKVKKSKPKKGPLDRIGPFRHDLVKVQKGKELRGLDWAYHINPLHPSTITKLHIKKIHDSMKYQIIKYIREGKLYILKSDKK